MRLLVDVIPFDNGRSGISQYALHVVRALAAAGHELTLLTEPDVATRFFPGYAAIEAPRWTRQAVLSMLWHLFILPGRIRIRNFDALLVLAANRRALRRCPLPTVGVVHDLSQYHVEAKYDVFRMFYIKRILPRYVRRMHRVVAISRSTAADLTQYWRLPASKVTVVYDGFTPPTVLRSADARSILYISRLEHPGKNHVGLIEAYGRLPRELAGRHPLVLAGGDWNGSEAVHAAAEASPYRAFIQLKGFVPDEDVPKLWADAAAYAFPSRFEGFGLSLLEAMAAGVPVACAKTSSLGELGAGVAELFDPESPAEMADALHKLLTEDNAARIAAGRARAAEFSWTRCAAGLLAAFPKAEVFGVPITAVTMADALEAIARAVREPADRPRFFSFANAHALNLAYTDRAFADILAASDAVWPDGTGVRLAGRRLGFPVPENVNGTDLFPLLADRAAREGWTVFFYGAHPGVAEQAAESACRAHPGLRVAGTCDGYAADDRVLALIRAARPDILLVAKGMPLQEKWIAHHRTALACRAVLAVGGLLDFVSGRIPRAPRWMRRLGIEWLYRLKCEPVRMFRRYVIGNPLFVIRLRRAARAVAAGLLLAVLGCAETSYNRLGSWAMRQNDIPPYATPYDIFYLVAQTNDWRVGRNAVAISAYARQRTECLVHPDGSYVRRQARVFAPFVLNTEQAGDDACAALEYYLKAFHDKGRPYIVIAEGASVEPAKAALWKLGRWPSKVTGWFTFKWMDGLFGRVDATDGFLAAYVCDGDPAEASISAAAEGAECLRSERERHDAWQETGLGTNGLNVAGWEVLLEVR